MPCYTGRYSPYSNFWWRRYFRGSWLSFSIIDECSVRATKLSYRKHIKLIILNLTILKTFCQNFVDCEFLRELKSSDILADVRFEGIFSIYVWSCSLYTVRTFFGIYFTAKTKKVSLGLSKTNWKILKFICLNGTSFFPQCVKSRSRNGHVTLLNIFSPKENPFSAFN